MYTKLSEMLMTSVRATVPNVGRNAVTPHLAAGYVMDPAVSEPIANGTIPSAGQKYISSYSSIYFINS
jgi:hypothetical protein